MLRPRPTMRDSRAAAQPTQSAAKEVPGRTRGAARRSLSRNPRAAPRSGNANRLSRQAVRWWGEGEPGVALPHPLPNQARRRRRITIRRSPAPASVPARARADPASPTPVGGIGFAGGAGGAGGVGGVGAAVGSAHAWASSARSPADIWTVLRKPPGSSLPASHVPTIGSSRNLHICENGSYLQSTPRKKTAKPVRFAHLLSLVE